MAGKPWRWAVLSALFGTLGCGSARSASLTEAPAGGTGGVAGAASTPEAGGALAAGGRVVVVVPPEAMATPPECQREVSFTAVVLDDPPPFDLILVADHSDSLSFSRDDLSAGLRGLLDHVRGRAVRVFLLTPTQYGASSEPAQRPLSGESVVSWRDPSTGEAFTNQMTNYAQSCTDPQGAPIDCPSSKGRIPYKVHGSWQFEMPEPIAVLTPEMDEAAFVAEQARVSEAVLALETGGSPEEQPLCTLARYFTQSKSLLPSHAVFLLITDEDDLSSPKACLAAFDAELKITERETSVSACSESCDAYRYSATGQRYWQRLAYTCAAFDDLGNPQPGTQKSSWLNENAQQTCDGFPAGPCTQAESERARPLCPAGLELSACERECTQSSFPCYLDRPDQSVDLCAAPFDQSGVRYDDLVDYCSSTQDGTWSSCTSQGIQREVEQSIVGTHSPTPLVRGETTGDLARHVRSEAVSKLGQGNFLIEAIVLGPDFDCPVSTGQSEALNLIEFVADRRNVFPLCESYAPALDGVFGFAQSLVQTEFGVALEPDEHITGVSIVLSDGTERVLAADAYTFDETSSMLRIDPAALGATGTSLRVEVTSDCRQPVN